MSLHQFTSVQIGIQFFIWLHTSSSQTHSKRCVGRYMRRSVVLQSFWLVRHLQLPPVEVLHLFPYTACTASFPLHHRSENQTEDSVCEMAWMKLIWTVGIRTAVQMKRRFDHRSCKAIAPWHFSPKRIFRTSTGFEPTVSALALQCSTNWAIKTICWKQTNLLSSSLPVTGMKRQLF